jgi:hypothetical protein
MRPITTGRRSLRSSSRTTGRCRQWQLHGASRSGQISTYARRTVLPWGSSAGPPRRLQQRRDLDRRVGPVRGCSASASTTRAPPRPATSPHRGDTRPRMPRHAWPGHHTSRCAAQAVAGGTGRAGIYSVGATTSTTTASSIPWPRASTGLSSATRAPDVRQRAYMLETPSTASPSSRPIADPRPLPLFLRRIDGNLFRRLRRRLQSPRRRQDPLLLRRRPRLSPQLHASLGGGSG